MELIEVYGLPHFLDLGKYPASFKGKRNVGGNELTEALNGDEIELAVSFIENKKSCGISFEDVGQKAYQRLIGIGIHRSARFYGLLCI